MHGTVGTLLHIRFFVYWIPLFFASRQSFRSPTKSGTWSESRSPGDTRNWLSNPLAMSQAAYRTGSLKSLAAPFAFAFAFLFPFPFPLPFAPAFPFSAPSPSATTSTTTAGSSSSSVTGSL